MLCREVLILLTKAAIAAIPAEYKIIDYALIEFPDQICNIFQILTDK
ncbi:hypothetical protein [Lactococcus lactis]|nr:hypothetical protein [Lactococcus lactis]